MQHNRSAPRHAAVSAEGVHEPERVVWTVREASRHLGLPLPTVYAYIKSGVLPAIRLGGRLLIPRAAVLALVDQAMAEWGGPDAG